ncbi:ig-like domain-containing protein [Caerostris extrusa]|uniref:Ig-like domain-containing protein n=1 Tax=Caerostris extrusa TaxID=172846 RepID=A0AAV4X5S5_CAEEX|nr:ig-like domain-containing protein [Caerostris extrusa]
MAFQEFCGGLATPKARALIEGAPDIYVKSGSSINLTCVITQSPVPPAFVFWYHDERMINYDSTRGLIAVQKAGRTPPSPSSSSRTCAPPTPATTPAAPPTRRPPASPCTCSTVSY